MAVNFQERLVQISRGFDNLIYVVNEPKGSWKEISITYSGDEVFDGVLNENTDILITRIFYESGKTVIEAQVKVTVMGTLQKQITAYFDPTTPFYILNEGKVEPNSRKLKQTINIQIKGKSEFIKDEIDFGEIKEGTVLPFEFTYTGDRVITGVKGSCGCTDVSSTWNKVQGTINTSGFKGAFQKGISVYFGDIKNFYIPINGVLKQNPNVSVYQLTIKGFGKSTSTR